MLVAYDQDQQLINLAEEIPNRKISCFCPACKSPVRLKNGSVMKAHFAHVHLDQCQFASENESAQHLSLKTELYKWLNTDEEVAVEQFIPEINQMADLLVNHKLALEVQCSSLSIKRLRERTENYHRAGYQVLWLLGKDLWLRDRLTPLHKHFLAFSQNMGFHLWELDLKKEALRLRYLIHEDLHGKVQCLTRIFPFGEGNCLSIFRQPYIRQPLHSFEGKLDKEICHYIRQQLYHQAPKWMTLQAEAYERRENLLTKTVEDFYPQVRLPSCKGGFTQIAQDLTAYYEQFAQFYRLQEQKHRQILYSPIYYQRVQNS